MKFNLAKVILALVSVAFLLSCQDIGSGPTGPDGLAPQFNKADELGNHDHGGGGDGGGDNPGSPFYEYTFTGDITTDPLTAGGRRTVGNDEGGAVRLHGCCDNDPTDGIDDEELILDALLVELVGAVDAGLCFGGMTPLLQFIGTLRPDKRVVNKVEAVFHFTAKDKSGTPDVQYVLRLDGTVTLTDDDEGDGIFPPELGETTTVTFDDARIGAKRNKEKNACSGGGPLPNGPSGSDIVVVLVGTAEVFVQQVVPD